MPATAPLVESAKAAKQASVHVSEIFSSIQGEGTELGKAHLFVRLYGCHLQCRFCDTPETVTGLQPPKFRPPSFRFLEADERIENPCSAEQLYTLIQKAEVEHGPHDAVAITGGEPLIQAQFLTRLLPLIREGGQRIYLETSGDLVGALAVVQPWIDIIAMDLKLPSSAGQRPRWRLHRDFLAKALEGTASLTIKVVVHNTTTDADICEARNLVGVIGPICNSPRIGNGLNGVGLGGMFSDRSDKNI